MIKALIFDFDGTILDTEVPEFEAWQVLFKEYNAELPLHLYQALIGTSHAQAGFHPFEHLQTQVPHPLDKAATLNRVAALHLAALQQAPPLPGVLSLIDQAQSMGLKLAIASSARCAWVTMHLQRLGLLGHFPIISCADHVTLRKPDPELYLHALNSLQIAPHEAIAFEDSRNGALASTKAGIFTVIIPHLLTAAMDLSMADLRVESLAAINLTELISHVQQQSIQEG